MLAMKARLSPTRIPYVSGGHSQRLLLIAIIWLAFFWRVHKLDVLPPGLFVDEAFYGLDALAVGEAGHFPLFFPANNGREPLFIYLQAAAIHLLGLSPWSMRLVAAFAGVLAVPLAYATGRRLFAGQSQANLVGLVAAVVMATLFWHVQLSRLVFRAVLLPVLALTAVFLYWRGWHSGRRGWYVAAGLALGLSQYTYLAARLLPLVFLAFVPFQHLTRNRPTPEKVTHDLEITAAPLQMLRPKIGPWQGLAWQMGMALVVSLPLWLTLALNPGYVSGRTADVSLWSAGSGPAPLVENGWLVARMFLDQGDLNLRHNLPGRSALDLMQMIGFWTGLLLCLRHWRRPQHQLLLWWLVVMLLPTLLSTEAPHYLRASGALGAVVILVAVGWTGWWETAVSRLPRLNLRPVRWLLPLSLLLLSGPITTRDYFGHWANTPFLYDAFESLETEAALAVHDALAYGPVYLTPDLAGQNSRALELLLRPTPVRTFATGCLVYPAQTERTTAFLVRTQRDQETLARLQALFPQGVSETAVFHPDSGEIFFESLTVGPGTVAARPATTAAARFANTIQLRDFAILHADDTISVRFDWYAGQTPGADHTLFLHLYPVGAADAPPVAQLDQTPCLPTGQWQPGEVVQDRYSLALSPAIKPGLYTLAVGWYTWPHFERLPVISDRGEISSDRFVLGQIMIPE